MEIQGLQQFSDGLLLKQPPLIGWLMADVLTDWLSNLLFYSVIFHTPMTFHRPLKISHWPPVNSQRSLKTSHWPATDPSRIPTDPLLTPQDFPLTSHGRCLCGLALHPSILRCHLLHTCYSRHSCLLWVLWSHQVVKNHNLNHNEAQLIFCTVAIFVIFACCDLIRMSKTDSFVTICSGGSWQSLRLPEEKEGTSLSTDTVILQELMFNNVSTRNGPKTTTTKTKLIFPDTATRQQLMLRRTILARNLKKRINKYGGKRRWYCCRDMAPRY